MSRETNKMRMENPRIKLKAVSQTDRCSEDRGSSRRSHWLAGSLLEIIREFQSGQSSFIVSLLFYPAKGY